MPDLKQELETKKFYDWEQDAEYSRTSPEPTQQFIIQTAVQEMRVEDAAMVWSNWYKNISEKIRLGQEVPDMEREGFEESLLSLPGPEPLPALVYKSVALGQAVEPTLLPTKPDITRELTEFLKKPEAKAHYLGLMLGNFVPINDSWRRVSMDCWQPTIEDMEWLVEKAYELREFPNTRERIEVALTINPDRLLRLVMGAIRKNRILSSDQ